MISKHLLLARSRLAPNRSVTIPRLELMAASLLSKLIKFINDEMHINSSIEFSDSKVALHWIKNDQKLWKGFVLNRVMQIRKFIPLNCWNYVNTRFNPSDVATRGASFVELKNCKIWWHGTNTLQNDQYDENDDDIHLIQKEEKRICNTSTIDNNNLIDLQRFSNYDRCIRALAFVKLFIFNRKTSMKNKSPLSGTELIDAE